MATKNMTKVVIDGINVTSIKTELFSLANKEMIGESDIKTVYTSLYKLLNSLIVSANDTNKNLDFIANLILFTKNDMHIRQFPLAATVAFLHSLRINKVVYANSRKLVCDVIVRADELADMYSLALGTFGNKKSVPMSIKRGVADAFNKFNEYSFGKYKHGNSTFSLRDVLLVTHPVAKNDKLNDVFAKIRDDKLAIPVTWETELSENGKLPVAQQKSKADIWTDLLNADKLGYIALIRNIRNIIDAGVSQSVIDAKWCSKIADKNLIEKSGVLPFQLYTTYDTVRKYGSSSVLAAISTALDMSLANIPDFGNNVALIHDVSGSMSSAAYNSMTPAHYSALYVAAIALANKHRKVDLIQFSTNAKQIALTGNSVIQVFDNVYKTNGGGTDIGSAFKLIKSSGTKYDTIIVLSDGDINVHSVSNYTDSNLGLGSDSAKICFNFNSKNGHVLTDANGWLHITGHSDRIFEFIKQSKSVDSVAKYLSVAYNEYK